MMVYILGISGPTSSGKSYFTTALIKQCTDLGLPYSIISTDDFYLDRSELKFEERCRLNYDIPSAISKAEFLESVKSLRNGMDISVPIYDFNQHNRTGDYRDVKAVDLIIIEGIFSFSFDEINEFYNLKIFVKLKSDLRLIRRIQRDYQERGRSVDSTIDQYLNTIRPTQNEYVESDEKIADIILPGDKNHSSIIQLITNFIESQRN